MASHFSPTPTRRKMEYVTTTRTTTRRGKKYGFFAFLFDLFMICITAGFWLIWIFVREMRKL